MQSHFYGLADELTRHLHPDEVYLLNAGRETSDFVRFNRSLIRQPGSVQQASVSLRLVKGNRHVTVGFPVEEASEPDTERMMQALGQARECLSVVPEDPYLLYNEEVASSETVQPGELPPAHSVVEQVLRESAGQDLVGIYAAGTIEHGFASSLGQRNWFSTDTFNLDWSMYLQGDKAVKSAYAGTQWDPGVLSRKMEQARHQLTILERPPRDIPPGEYRVYLSPWALDDITGMMSWGGFGLRAHRTRQTPFLRMLEGKATLSPMVNLSENTAGGTAPDFTSAGYRRPPRVPLLTEGKLDQVLVSPRSAREFGVPTNGADSSESPSSLEMAPGDIPADSVLERLGNGVLVGNLWYCNFSDRNAFRITGMTRFATFWVEEGRIVAPLNVMRFDESVYRMLGENLLGLGAEQEMILSASTYGGRGTDSVRLPGALIDSFRFTL